MTLAEHHDSPGAVAFGNPVRLFDRYDGTYFHPAPSATAEHCINFWASVRIPDEIITQAKNAYHADRQQEINDDMEDTMREWTIRWMKENPEPGRKAGPAATEEYNQRFRDEHEVHRQKILPSVEAKRPLHLGSYDAPQIIRAVQMGLHCPNPDFFPDEVPKVMEHPVELIGGNLAVYDIWKKYDLNRVMPYITDLVKPDTTAAMLEAMSLTNELLSAWQFERNEERIAAMERGDS